MDGQGQQLILVVTTDASRVTPGTPAIVVGDEDELERVASELGKIFYADVNRLSNGVVVVKTPAR